MSMRGIEKPDLVLELLQAIRHDLDEATADLRELKELMSRIEARTQALEEQKNQLFNSGS